MGKIPTVWKVVVQPATNDKHAHKTHTPLKTAKFQLIPFLPKSFWMVMVLRQIWRAKILSNTEVEGGGNAPIGSDLMRRLVVT